MSLFLSLPQFGHFGPHLEWQKRSPQTLHS